MISEKARQKLLIKSTSDLLKLKSIITEELDYREEEQLRALSEGLI